MPQCFLLSQSVTTSSQTLASRPGKNSAAVSRFRWTVTLERRGYRPRVKASENNEYLDLVCSWEWGWGRSVNVCPFGIWYRWRLPSKFFFLRMFFIEMRHIQSIDLSPTVILWSSQEQETRPRCDDAQPAAGGPRHVSANMCAVRQEAANTWMHIETHSCQTWILPECFIYCYFASLLSD